MAFCRVNSNFTFTFTTHLHTPHTHTTHPHTPTHHYHTHTHTPHTPHTHTHPHTHTTHPRTPHTHHTHTHTHHAHTTHPHTHHTPHTHPTHTPHTHTHHTPTHPHTHHNWTSAQCICTCITPVAGHKNKRTVSFPQHQELSKSYANSSYRISTKFLLLQLRFFLELPLSPIQIFWSINSHHGVPSQRKTGRQTSVTVYEPKTTKYFCTFVIITLKVITLTRSAVTVFNAE
jgi:hypothetical protein